MKTPRLIAIASGKGGTGKSLLAANVAIFLATLGRRVVVIDAAFGSANVHTLLGVPQPERTLAEMLGDRDVALEDVVVPTLVSGLGLVAGHSDPGWAANPRVKQLARMRREMRTLDADFVVVDLASGTGSAVIDLFNEADVGLLMVLPEPTSVELSYRFARAAFMRKLRQSELADDAKRLSAECVDESSGIPAPLDLYRAARGGAREGDEDPPLAAALRQMMAETTTWLVVNHVRARSDMQLGPAIARAGRRRLGLPLGYMGHLEYDDAVWASLRRRRPLLIEHPESRASKCIEKLTRRMVGRDAEKPPGEPLLGGETLYELLDIEPTAAEEQIRRANRRTREIYGRDSVVISGLLTGSAIDEMHRRIEGAYSTLMDPIARKEYDQALFPNGVPLHANSVAEPSEATDLRPRVERPPLPELAPDTEYSGGLLRSIREAQGLELREISERTKIGMSYLRAIEGEIVEKLPATVYVRGFLTEYARMLRLDVERVLETYLERVRG